MISLCMIVKNEIDVLEKCILSVKTKLNKTVNDIVVVDTGSTDGTKELAESLGCRVFDFEWVNDFSNARNFSVSKAKNDWVLILDADEYIIEANQKELKDLCRREYEHVLASIVIASLNDNNEVFDRVRIGRLYNRKKYEYRESIHEAVFPIGKFSTAGYKLKLTVEHTGYKDSTKESKGKNEFYIKMIKEALEKDASNLYLVGQLGNCYRAEKDNDKAIECYEKIVFNETCINEPYYQVFVNEYMRLLIHLEQYNIAVICKQLWSYCSHDDAYVHYMGLVHLNLGQLQEAVDCFIDCVNRTDETLIDKKYSYYQIGSILEQTGDLKNAIVCFEQCGDFSDSQDRVIELRKKAI